jgi:hypothetical protein
MRFHDVSRVWKQADFFTLLCELDYVTSTQKKRIDLEKTKEKLTTFYHLVDEPITLPIVGVSEDVTRYIKAAIQAANDRVNRVARGQIIRKRIVTLQ